VLPQPLRDYTDGDVDGLRWRSLGGGVRHLPIDTGSSRAKARLLYIPAGSKVPDHGHRGLELTLVLAGSFYDEGAWFRRGDVEEADATVEHQPVAGPEEACICLAVTDAPLRFRSLIPRLAQPFLGI
jgi:putative transcriptional regulator